MKIDFRSEFETKEQRAMLSLMKEQESCDLEFMKEIDMDTFFQLCCEHEVEGLVVAHLSKYGYENLPDDWQLAYDTQKRKMAELITTAEQVATLLKEHGIDMVVLKNGGIMIDMEPDYAKCAMGDLDTLVRKADMKKAHELLMEHGFHFKFRSEFEFEDFEEALKDGATEYYIEGKENDPIWLELAWRAIAGRWIRRDLEPDTEELMDCSYLSPGSNVRILSPEDNLLQVSIHTAKHSYVRAPGLRLHMDVERIVTKKEIDWQLFVSKVKKTRVKTAVYFSLLIPKQLFGTEIPDWVLKELSPGSLKKNMIYKLLRKAGLLHPNEDKFGKIDFVFFQCLLYDGFSDLWKVFYPGAEWMKERYGYNNALLLPYYLFKRGLDLVGIRKKKED